MFVITMMMIIISSIVANTALLGASLPITNTSNRINSQVISNEFIINPRQALSTTNQEQIEYFLKYWSLQRNMRFNFNRIMESCKNDMNWKSYYVNKTPYMITSASHSKVTLDIREAGQYSRLIIKSYSLMNTRKNIGGDSWRILVKGTASVPVTTIDNSDGTYEMSFLIIDPGPYFIELYLEQTLCDGFKDPPPDWYRKGDEQGKFQSPDVLPGNERPYLEEKYHDDLSFTVYKNEFNAYKELSTHLSTATDPSCLLWDGFGQWNKESKWIPYISEPLKRQSNIKLENGKGIFWIYGDSTGKLFFEDIENTKLCHEVFRICNRTINKIYNVVGKSKKGGKDFNVTRILVELETALTNPLIDDPNSVLFLNYGLHYVMDVSFEMYIIMIDGIIELLKSYKNIFKGTIIFRTTNAMQKWKYGGKGSDKKHGKYHRFLTEPRTELFNALSNYKLCEAGFDILDIFPMSYAYPDGTGTDKKPWGDMVHYVRSAFLPVEKYLYDYFNMNVETV